MEPIWDELFGELELADGYWSGKIEVTFLDVTASVGLIVEGNDEQGSIFDEQREGYRQLSNAIPKAEDAILSFYQDVCDDYRDQFGDDADNRMPIISRKVELFGLVTLTGVILPRIKRRGDISVGFFLECSWEPEHGLGVKITDGRIEVGMQNILT